MATSRESRRASALRATADAAPDIGTNDGIVASTAAASAAASAAVVDDLPTSSVEIKDHRSFARGGFSTIVAGTFLDPAAGSSNCVATKVALKCAAVKDDCHPGASDASLSDCLLRKEAYLYGYLKHPALLRCFGSLTTAGGKHALVLELMEGGSLQNVFTEAQRVAAARAAGATARFIPAFMSDHWLVQKLRTAVAYRITTTPVATAPPPTSRVAASTTMAVANIAHDLLPAAFTARVLRDVASALTYLHELQHAHGDVQKGNVLLEVTPDAWLSAADVDDDGWRDSARPIARLSDLGTVRDLRIPGDLPSIYMPVPGVRSWPGAQVFTSPAITAPEVLRGAPKCILKPWTPMSDVWSWGVLTWELTTGKEAWSDLPSIVCVRRQVLAGKDLQWPDMAPAGFDAMQKLGQSALARDADARPSSRQLLVAMNAVVASLDVGRPSGL